MRPRSILIGIGVAAVAVIAIVAFTLSRLDPAEFLSIAIARVKQHTGRELVVDGRIGYTVSLVPSLSLEGVRFQNASWGSRPDMILAKRLEVEIALLPLLSGKVDIRGLSLIEPDVLLETDAQGRGNWEFGQTYSKQKPAEAEQESKGFGIRRAHVDKGVLTYRSAQDKKERKLDIVQLGIRDSGTQLRIDLDGRLNGEALQVQATVGRDSSAGTIDVVAKSSGLTLTASSTKESAAGGKFDLEVRDWKSLAKLAAMDPIDLPVLKASGTLKSAIDAWSIEGLKGTLGKSDFTGAMRIDTAHPAPNFDIKLDSTLLDLAELRGTTKKESPKDGRLFSAEPLPIALLKELDGRMEARIARLALTDGKTVDSVEFQAVADHGRIRADPIRLQIDGRELRLRAHLDASSAKTLAADIGIDGTGISLGALSALLGLPGTPEGSPTDINIRFAGRGSSIRALMADTNGDVRIVIGPGRLRNRSVDWGADITELLNAVNPARASEPYTELKCAVVRLPFRQGVARIDNSIAAETSKVNIIAGGIIDLRNEAVDLGFRTKAATGLGIGVGSLANLGRLRGSLTHPRVELDMGAAAKAAAQIGLAAATSGLSLLASGVLFDNVPDQPCQAALSGRARTQDRSAQQEPNVIDSAVGGIKKLFGR